jgi:hypothetical protein
MTNTKYVLSLFAAILLLAVGYGLAHALPYAPGQTLNPSCTPGSANCTVQGTIIDNGTVSGVNATSSTVNLNVQGTGNLNPFNVASSTGTSLLTVSANGNVTVGTTELAADGTYSQVSPDTYIAQNLYEYSDTYYHGFGQVFYRAGGTSASPTYPPSSAYFMAQRFWGYDGVHPWTEAVALVFQTTEQWSATNQGTGFFVEITPQGTTGTHRYIVMDSTDSGGISIGQPTDTASIVDS